MRIEKIIISFLILFNFVSAESEDIIGVGQLRGWFTAIMLDSIVPLLVIGVLAFIFWILKQIRENYNV